MKIVKIYREKDCPNCEIVKPVFEAFKAKYTTLSYEEVDADADKETVKKYAPQGSWKFPLICFVENEQTMLYTSGVVSIETLEANLSLALKDIPALKILKEEIRDVIDGAELKISQLQSEVEGMKQNVRTITEMINIKAPPK